MSDARAIRTARQTWAAPGSSHDRLIGALQIALPVAIGVLGALVVFLPLYAGGDVSFLLDKNKVEVARERLRVRQASYRGEDTRGRPFALTAGSAVQKSAAEPIVRLDRLSAEMGLSDGPARVVADKGRYDMDTQQVKIDGPLRFVGQGGYRLDTRDATLDLKTRQMRSGGAVTGQVPQGDFSGNRMVADLDRHIVRIDGNARLRIGRRSAR